MIFIDTKRVIIIFIIAILGLFLLAKPAQTEVMVESLEVTPLVEEKRLQSYQEYLENEYFTETEFDILVRCVDAEARGQQEEAIEAVTCVILNRVDSKLYPNSIEGVVFQEGQFDVVAYGMIRRQPLERTFLIVQRVYENPIEYQLKYKDYIAFDSYVTIDTFSGWLTYVETIDDLNFWR